MVYRELLQPLLLIKIIIRYFMLCNKCKNVCRSPTSELQDWQDGLGGLFWDSAEGLESGSVPRT